MNFLISQNVRRRGHPRKNGPGLALCPPKASSSQPPAKRGPGRPRKNGAISQAIGTKKRPRKINNSSLRLCFIMQLLL